MTDEIETAAEDAPQWDRKLPDLPEASEVPEGSAVEADAMAGRMIRALDDYRERLRPALEADPPVVDAEALELVVSLRRRVGIVTDVMIRRDFAESVSLAAGVAHRVAERIVGLALHAAERAGHLTPAVEADVVGGSADVFRAAGAASDDEFEEALRAAAARGDVGRNVVLAALAPVTEFERTQRATIGRLAGTGATAQQIGAALAVPVSYVLDVARVDGLTVRAEPVDTPTVDAGAVLPGLIADTITAAAAAQTVDAAAVRGLTPAAAADYSRALFAHAKHLVALRVRLDEYAQGRTR